MAQSGANLFSKINISTSRNPLITHASEILGYFVAIPSQQYPNDLVEFRYKLMLAISLYSEQITHAGTDEARLEQCQRVICDAIDEAILTTQWGKDANWKENTLAKEAFPNRNTEKDLFYLLSQAQLSPEENIDLLEFFYVIIMLGYDGRFRNGDKKRLLGIKNELFRLIKQYRSTPVLSSTEPHKKRERPLNEVLDELPKQKQHTEKKKNNKQTNTAEIKPLSSSPLIQHKKERSFNVVVLGALFIILLSIFFLFIISQFSDTYELDNINSNNRLQIQQNLQAEREALEEEMDALKYQQNQLSHEYPSAKQSDFIVEHITDWRLELGTFQSDTEINNIIIPIENSGMIVHQEQGDEGVTLYLTLNSSKSEAEILKQSLETELKVTVSLIQINPKMKKAPEVPK